MYKEKCTCGNLRGRYSSSCRSCAMRIRTWGEEGNKKLIELAHSDSNIEVNDLMFIADKYYIGKADKEDKSLLRSLITRSLKILGYKGEIVGRLHDNDQSYIAYRNRLMSEATYKGYKKETCYLCGSEKELAIHHIVPISWGGGSSKENCITLCKGCHKKAHKELREDLNRQFLLELIEPHQLKIKNKAINSLIRLL